MFIIVLAVLAAIVLIIGALVAVFDDEGRLGGVITAVIALLGGGAALLFGSFYSQSANEATVEVSVSGAVVGTTTGAGWHHKAPWDHVEHFDIKNQQIGFNNRNATYPTSAISVTDADGVSATIDMTMQFSIDPSKVEDIYKSYKTEESFIDNYVIPRSNTLVRNIPTTMHTLSLITGNVAVSSQATKQLQQDFASSGLEVASVSVANIDYPASIRSAYEASAQSAIKVQTAQNNQAAAKIDAQTNGITSSTLTPQYLELQYINALDDAAKNKSLIVVPSDGSAPIINLPSAK